jgi:hypothetical protein
VPQKGRAQNREDRKTPVIINREFERLRTMREVVAEFDCRPYACRKNYGIIVLRQFLSREKGQLVLFEAWTALNAWLRFSPEPTVTVFKAERHPSSVVSPLRIA